jgi:hypothetical protein
MGMEVVGMEMEAVVETDGSATDAVDVFGTDTATGVRMAST